MSWNDPIVLWGIGALAAVGAWYLRREDRRISDLEVAVAALKVQMAGHDGNKQLLDRMYGELQELTKLTNRIAGHLKID
jgi:hypothetical protein